MSQSDLQFLPRRAAQGSYGSLYRPSLVLSFGRGGAGPSPKRACVVGGFGHQHAFIYQMSLLLTRYDSDLSDDRRLSDLSDYRRLADSPHAYRHSPTKGQLDFRRLPESQSDYARYAGAYGDFLRNAQMQLHASYQRRL